MLSNGSRMILRKIYITCFTSVVIFFLCLSVSEGGSPLKLLYATHFHVDYLQNGCKKVTDGAGRELLLVPQRKKPDPAYRKDVTIVRIPVSKVITRWSTIPAFLKALGVMNTLVGVTTRKEEWCAEDIKMMMDQGIIKNIGTRNAVDYEELYVIKPDIFFASTWEKTSKLMELGIPVAKTSEYLEGNPLGRLEWIKFFAAFYDKEKEAKEYFDKAVNEVRRLSEKIANVKKRPRILWGAIRIGGTIYAPTGKCYVSKMIAISGGDSILKGLRRMENAPITLEYFCAHGSKADIYICPEPLLQDGITTIKKLVFIHPIISAFKSVKTGNVFCFQPWYWESIDKTDEIMEDLAAIFHPGLFPEHKLRYFVKLPAQ